MPLPKPPTRPGDTLETTALAATPETSPVRAVPGPALDVSLDAPRARGAKTRPVAAILSRSSDRATPEARPAPAAAQAAAPAAKAAPAPVDKAPHEGKPAAAPGKAAPAPARPAAARARPKRLPVSQRKLFVLDTNVLLHDSSSLFRFAEHDVFLPMIVLEELDHQKKGMSEVARNARQVSRHLDQLIGTADLSKGVPLDTLGNTDALGSLHFQTRPTDTHLPLELPMGKADNVILGVVHGLCQENPKREVVLVSKDINMRLKARALGLPAEDYLNDHVLDDSDLLYDGVMPLPENFWNKHGKDIESWQQNGLTWYRVRGPLCGQFIVNEFVYYEGEMPLYAQVREVTGKSAVLSTLRDFSHAKNSVWGVTTRNREQNFALNLLMDPECDFVTLTGSAGTGKTLMTLAAALCQVLDERRYTEIIVTRVTVPVGEDIGFLPGTEEEKMSPWMGALDDNLEVLARGDTSAGEWGRAATNELVRSKIKIKSMNFMRGRTFLNKFLIIDEAQNLTPKQMKTLITRAGPGTKIICLGNLAQIDTPYLTEGSSGLTFAVDKFKGWPHSGHVTLARGERSRLADFASEVL